MGGEQGPEINQNLAFQRREWRVQSIGWWALTAFIAAAVLGVFGGGPLSRARAGETSDPIWIEYERFVRVGKRARFTVHASAPPRGQPLQLQISRPYFEALVIERVTPEPDAVRVGADHVTLEFSTDPPPRAVILDVQPHRAGLQRGAIASGPDARHTFTQFAYF